MAEYVCADGRMSVNGMCSISNQGNNNITKDYSKDVKSNFQWDFDKVGNKVENFGTTIKSNINAYDSYVEDNLGIPRGVSYGARTVGVAAGVGAYGAVGAALPFLIPFIAGGALNKKQEKENQRITQATLKDPQGGNSTVDMATYGIPTAGQTGFNIHNDSYDQGNNNNSGHNAPGAGKGEGGGYASDHGFI